MSDWVNHVTISLPRNGTTSHTIDPSNATGGGTVVGGTPFVPTAGRCLVVIGYGSVTFTTPSGLTLPAGGSQINSGGLYSFYSKTIAAAWTGTTTHNGTSYPVVFDIYEFPAGSDFYKVAGATGVALAGGTGPNLTSMTGPHWLAAILGMGYDDYGTASCSWASGTELVDFLVLRGGSPLTAGFEYSLAEFNSDTSTSKSDAGTITYTGAGASNAERLMFALTVAAGAGPASFEGWGVPI